MAINSYVYSALRAGTLAGDGSRVGDRGEGGEGGDENGGKQHIWGSR